MTSLRWEPIRGHQNCPIATIWCTIKCVHRCVLRSPLFSMRKLKLLLNKFAIIMLKRKKCHKASLFRMSQSSKRSLTLATIG